VKTCTDHYAAAAAYDDLSRLSDTQFKHLGLSRDIVMPMEADDPIAIVIEALNPFQTRDDTDNLYRLYQLFDGFRALPDRDRAAPGNV